MFVIDLLHVRERAPLPAPLQIPLPLRLQRGVLVNREEGAAALRQVLHHHLPERVQRIRLLVNNHRRGRVGHRAGSPLDDAVTVQGLHVHQHALRHEERRHVRPEPRFEHLRVQLLHCPHVRRDVLAVGRPQLSRAGAAQLRGNQVLLRCRIEQRPDALLFQDGRDLLRYDLWKIDLEVYQVVPPPGLVLPEPEEDRVEAGAQVHNLTTAAPGAALQELVQARAHGLHPRVVASVYQGRPRRGPTASNQLFCPPVLEVAQSCAGGLGQSGIHMSHLHSIVAWYWRAPLWRGVHPQPAAGSARGARPVAGGAGCARRRPRGGRRGQRRDERRRRWHAKLIWIRRFGPVIELRRQSPALLGRGCAGLRGG
mmetsp:Transcript_16932/g.47116  ORF Transcript_16932/g.47116 Transcript_16932/m.47116 type:complete len:368 (-) Transcript_16932:411-1514(-)